MLIRHGGEYPTGGRTLTSTTDNAEGENELSSSEIGRRRTLNLLFSLLVFHSSSCAYFIAEQVPLAAAGTAGMAMVLVVTLLANAVDFIVSELR